MSSGKTTNPGWPDPTEWVNALRSELELINSEYEREADTFKRRQLAKAAMATVMAALYELPSLQSMIVLPIKDILIFLNDLDKGAKHPWSKPTPGQPTNSTRTAQAELVAWVRAVYDVLRSAGLTPTEAYKHIAKGLTASGRRSKDGSPMKPQRVGRWCRRDDAPGGVLVRAHVAAKWAEVLEQFREMKVLDEWGRPVSVTKLAEKFSDDAWKHEHFRDRLF